MISAADLIGKGIYTPHEAAVFAGVTTKRLVNWLHGSPSQKPVLIPDLSREAKTYTFHDLIEAVRTRRLLGSRQGRNGVTLQNIRLAVQEAHDEHGIEHPLARNNVLYRFGRRLVLRVGNQFVGVSRGDKGQLYHKPIIEPFLSEVSFDSEAGGLAKSWAPLEGNGFRVVLDPSRRFGQPYVEPGFMLVDALADAAYCEGSIEAAATAFDTKIEAVLLALKYRDDYLTRQAA